MATLHKTEGIILGHHDIGEADKLVRIYTRDFGKISLIAKGTRLAKSKLKSHINLGSHSRIAFVEGSDILRLTDAEEIFNYLRDAKNGKIQALSYAINFLDRMVQGSERDDGVWSLFVGFLKSPHCEQAASVIFSARLLHRLGYLEEPEDERIKKTIISPDWDISDPKHNERLRALCEKAITSSQL